MSKSTAIFTALFLCLSIQSHAQISIKYEVPFPKAIRDANDTVSLFIIGDVMMHSKQLEHDHTEFLARIAPDMRAADISVANLEFSCAGPPYTGYPSFSCPDYFPEYLANECGVDVFLTANNHVLDYGSDGLVRTLETYEKLSGSYGIKHTGSAASEAQLESAYPLLISKKGISIALINFTYGTNNGGNGKEWPKVNRMKKDEVHAAFERAKDSGADFIVALPHWGTEYQLTHDQKQQEWAEWLAQEGADIIIGSHPHVVQDTTHIGGIPVIYSLGNAVSNMSIINSRLELAVNVRFIINRSSGAKTMMEPELKFMWCTLPGRLTDSYATLFVKEWANRKNDWLTPSDFDNMIGTWQRVKAAAGISD